MIGGMGNSTSNTDTTPSPSPSQPQGAGTTLTKASTGPTMAPTTSTTGSTRHLATANITSRRSSSSAFLQGQPVTPRPASQQVRNGANNYVIPAAAAREQQRIKPHQEVSYEKLLVCPQYNGQGCVAEPCRRLHVCYHWATKTCSRNPCKHDHSLHSPHNQRLLQACLGRQNDGHLEVSDIIKEKGTLFSQGGPQICLFSIFNKCTKEPCSRVHYTKTYLWQVQHCSEWLQLFFNQSDYLEMMYSHPSVECVDLIPLNTPLPRKSSLKRLADLLSKEASWTVDFEAMQLKGESSVLDIQRLSTTSDLTSNVPVATRWLWYWQGDDGCWEPYGEGVVSGRYYVALGDYLESMRISKDWIVLFSVGRHVYSLDINNMTQKNLATSRTRSVRRRPACNSVRRESVKFDDLFLPLPASKTFLKLPVVPLSSEFIFVENLMRQTLPQVKATSMHRIQNDHLWRAYQTKKCLLTSLYSGEVSATNEQYLFHGTRLDVIDLICDENLDWKLSGTNVGHLYGRGTYFSNLALKAHQYTRSDKANERVMLVVLVLVGMITLGHKEMTLPPENTASGRTFDTTCDSKTSPTIFVKYNRDEYYPAYVVRYSC